jgi:hypothetical protein
MRSDVGDGIDLVDVEPLARDASGERDQLSGVGLASKDTDAPLR